MSVGDSEVPKSEPTTPKTGLLRKVASGEVPSTGPQSLAGLVKRRREAEADVAGVPGSEGLQTEELPTWGDKYDAFALDIGEEKFLERMTEEEEKQLPEEKRKARKEWIDNLKGSATSLAKTAESGHDLNRLIRLVVATDRFCFQQGYAQENYFGRTAGFLDDPNEFLDILTGVVEADPGRFKDISLPKRVEPPGLDVPVS